MHDDRFDHLTRRRAAVSSLLGASLLSLAARLAPDAEAKKRRKGKGKNRRKCKKVKCKCPTCETGFTCGPGTKECETSCVPSDSCCGGCGEQTCCDGACADLATDGANCGQCGTACFRDICFNGACACSLAPDGGCAGGCECIPRLEGGFGCAAFGQPGAACTTDNDCPFGTFCANEQGNGNCSLPCSVT